MEVQCSNSGELLKFKICVTCKSAEYFLNVFKSSDKICNHFNSLIYSFWEYLFREFGVCKIIKNLESTK